MASQRLPKLMLAAAGVIAVAAVAVGAFFALRDTGGPRPDPSALFRESAAEVGLTWRMRFLNHEQGETFKINLYDHGAGVAVADFDGDGFDDIYFCDQLGPNALYRNKGDGTFEDVTEAAGVALGDRVCVAATWVDYDNDGRPDLYVTSTRGGNVLFRNLGGGKFQDVTKEAGLTHVGHSQTALFFDYNNDGHLDLFLTNTAKWTDKFDEKSKYYVGKGADGFAQVIQSEKESNVLYRNNGDGTFTDVTTQAGLKGRGWAGDAVAFDYDGDGHMDLFVTSMFGRAQLYRNNGDGTFQDVTLDALGRTPWGGLGAKVVDFANSGRLGLYVVDMHSDMWMGLDRKWTSLAQAKEGEKVKYPYMFGPRVKTDPSLMGQEMQLAREVGFKHDEVIFGNAYYRNDGRGKFTEMSDDAGLETFWPWGIATGDFDNDGWEDAFEPAGMGYPFYYWPNYLLMNQGNGTFVNRAVKAGIDPPPRGTDLPEKINGQPMARSSRAAAVADFRNVGRLDIVVNNFNDTPYFFQNQNAKKNYVQFRLTGTRSNRDAIGAVVRLYRGDKVMTRQVQGAGGYLAQSSKTVHFGLGDSPAFDRVEITWPGGTKQTLDGLAANQRHDVTEPDKAK